MSCKHNEDLPIDRELSTVRGDTFVRTLIVKMGGEPLMLGDDGECRFYVFYRDDIIIRKSYTADSQDEHGKITLTINPDDTQELEAGAYRYEVEIKIGSAVVTPLAGDFIIVEDMITPEVRDE